MTLILAAHGTRNPAGVAMIGDLAADLSRQLPDAGPVRVAFVDVLGPSPAEVLESLPADEPITVVPAFLARGFHVRADLPAQLAATRRRLVHLTPALGPSPMLAEAMVDRLHAAGYRCGDAVVMAAAGSSDPIAVADVRRTANYLEGLLGVPVSLAFAAPPTGSPVDSVATAVARARAGARRVAVASYLLADGLFQARLAASGADVVAGPLGVHPLVVDLACHRATSARLTAHTAIAR